MSYRNNTEVIGSSKGCMRLELRDFHQDIYGGEAGGKMLLNSAGEFSEGLHTHPSKPRFPSVHSTATTLRRAASAVRRQVNTSTATITQY